MLSELLPRETDQNTELTTFDDILSAVNTFFTQAQEENRDSEDSSLPDLSFLNQHGDIRGELSDVDRVRFLLAKKMWQFNRNRLIASGLTNSNWSTLLVFCGNGDRRFWAHNYYLPGSLKTRTFLAKTLYSKFYSWITKFCPQSVAKASYISYANSLSNTPRHTLSESEFIQPSISALSILTTSTRVFINIPVSHKIIRYVRYLRYLISKEINPAVKISSVEAVRTDLTGRWEDLNIPEEVLQEHASILNPESSSFERILTESTVDLPEMRVHIAVFLDGYATKFFGSLETYQQVLKTLSRARLCHYLNI